MSAPGVKAMAMIRRPSDGALLVQTDRCGGAEFDRLLGGSVEFGERAADAIRREVVEETGHHVANVRLLDVVENLFTLGGVPGHEVVFVFGADFVDDRAYDFDESPLLDRPEVTARWRTPGATTPPLYPVGVDAIVARMEQDER